MKLQADQIRHMQQRDPNPKVDPKLAYKMKVEEPSSNTISGMNTFGRNENSPVIPIKNRNHNMV